MVLSVPHASGQVPRFCTIKVPSCRRSSSHAVDQVASKHPRIQVVQIRQPNITLQPTQQVLSAVLLACLASGRDAAFAADAVAEAQAYVPTPIHVGWEVYAGAIAGVIPFVIGSYQFVARILIQRRCSRCKGSGLVERGPFLRKCPECGGFFPWQGWKQFLTSTAAPGNGGVLRQPRNQNGVIYRIPPSKAKDENDD